LTRNKKILGIAIIVIIVGLIIWSNYLSDQAKIRGYNFGTNLEQIQDKLKKSLLTFDSRLTMLNEGEIDKEEFLDYSKKHLIELENLISRYDSLDTPEPFSSSVELFRLSTERQFQSDQEMIKWIQSQDEAAKIRSDALLQDSFEYELAALAEFNSVKKQSNP